MLNDTWARWIAECEWIEEIEPGAMGDRYLEETYRLKDGAPDEVKAKWKEVCEIFHEVG